MAPHPHMNRRDILCGIFQFAISLWIMLLGLFFFYLTLPAADSSVRAQCVKTCIQTLLTNKTEF